MSRELPQTISDIQKVLPHRYPFLLVDRVLDFDGSNTLRALKNVTINEPFFQGHFPAQPVMPGVLQIEALAQAALLLSYMKGEFNPATQMAYFAGIDAAKFRRMVVPGDNLLLELSWLSSKRGVCKINGRATVNGELAAQAELTAVARDL